MAKVLFVATHGTDDPTRATFPFMEAKGVIEAGHETGIMLMMEAASLIKDRIAEQVQGVGVPPLKELMDFLFAHNIRISVCDDSPNTAFSNREKSLYRGISRYKRFR